MTILSPPIPAPAWLYTGRKRNGRVRLVQCDCGYAYAVDARKPLPERCLGCHHASMSKPTGWRTLRRLREEAGRAAA